jgi:hypothetical protein
MASVALASPRDPLDNLQARPTVYKSGTLKESTPSAFFCQTPVSSARQSHWHVTRIIMIVLRASSKLEGAKRNEYCRFFLNFGKAYRFHMHFGLHFQLDSGFYHVMQVPAAVRVHHSTILTSSSHSLFGHVI